MRLVVATAVLVAVVPGMPIRAQNAVPPLPSQVTYILPALGGAGEFGAAVADLRTRLAPNGEGQLVRLGFTSFIQISMTDWSVDTTNPAAVRAALASTIAQIDAAVTRGVTYNVPSCLSFLTAIRDRYDPAQTASEVEDRRTMQWYTDNGLAPGWWTHSQYARKQRRIQEAYIRELGKVVASYMSRYPHIVVAATGDGEVELSYERFRDIVFVSTAAWADYSPFAVAEFRDWLRQDGLYAAGQPLDGQGYHYRSR